MDRNQKKAEANKARRFNRKLHGLCPGCGKPTVGDFIYCPECREKSHKKKRKPMTDEEKAQKRAYDKQLIARYKKEHRCIHCGKTDAYTLSGKSRCYECTVNRREKERIKWYKNHEEKLRKKRERYERMLSEGICVSCGKRKVTPGRTRCQICRDRMNYRARAKRDTFVPDGICHFCKKNHVKEGYKLCEECYQRCCDALKKAREIKRKKIEEIRKIDPSYKEPFKVGNDLIFQKGARQCRTPR